MVMDRRTNAAASLTLVGNTTFTGLIYSQGDVELSGNGTIRSLVRRSLTAT